MEGKNNKQKQRQAQLTHIPHSDLRDTYRHDQLVDGTSDGVVSTPWLLVHPTPAGSKTQQM